ncbi:MAG: ATP-binding protein [Phycisphaerae bacterium]|nr:ATP-binding protein [Phycisphaerae bacterium]
MGSTPDAIDALRAALAVSPDNVPLRAHLAASLLRAGRAMEAADEYQEALRRSPEDSSLKLGLAQAHYSRGKPSVAMVIVEELLSLRDTPPAAYILHARLLLALGDAERAVRQYRRGIELDPGAGDESLAATLGINAQPDQEVVEGRIRGRHTEEDDEPTIEIERPDVNFADVGGMEDVKEEIRLKIIHPLSHPEIYAAYGKKIGGGILMYGPPGCGKTHLARATAGEVNAGFLSIGINDVLDMWVGQSEQKLHAVFQQARAHTPCVLFFDEVDALAAKRSDFRQSAARQAINQFLAELDGFDANNEGVLILAATNAPWHLDAAFRRPGRFDRIIFVPPPDAGARGEILRLLMKGKPAVEIAYDQIVKVTDGFSGADLRLVVDQAIEAKLTAAVRSGVPDPLCTRDLLAAVKKLRPTTKDWFSSARNHALYANEGGLYDDVLKYLKMK